MHVKGVKLAPERRPGACIAQRTPGFVGADLANLVNEAALLAARRRKTEVDMSDFDEAIDRVVAGLRKKNRLINPREREIVAVHETGHALVAAFTEGADKVHKISIIPRGIGALGMTQQLPTDDRYLMTRKELEARVDVLFGGRAAEQVVFNEISTGAHNDLDRATDIVRSMVLEYGMSDTLGPMTFPRRHGPGVPRRSRRADARAARVQRGHGPGARRRGEAPARRAPRPGEQLLTEKRPLLDRVSKALLEKETARGRRVRGAGAVGRRRRAQRRLTRGRGAGSARLRVRAARCGRLPS